jgi:predicted short-subunit dehydrogenase-like oxidoreductase (DUF2520 family)
MTETLAIVGAGRVGRTLGRRLRELGWRIGPVVTRSAATARAAVRAIGGGAPCAGLTRRIVAADVVLLTTPDSAVPRVAAELARLGGREWRGRVALHTSGALSSRSLRPLARAGAATGSLHPFQTFSTRAAAELDGALFTVEGDARAVRVARRLARALGGIVVRLDAGDKPAYHAAGGYAAGHLLTVLEAGTRTLMSLGFTRRQAVRALVPMARQTLANFERHGPGATWTGPLVRGDFGTIASHVAAMRRYPPEYAAAYAALSRLAVRLLAPGDAALRRRLERALAGR